MSQLKLTVDEVRWDGNDSGRETRDEPHLLVARDLGSSAEKSESEGDESRSRVGKVRWEMNEVVQNFRLLSFSFYLNTNHTSSSR